MCNATSQIGNITSLQSGASRKIEMQGWIIDDFVLM
jgi:hypothetical protein